jgi:hypothetical protein
MVPSSPQDMLVRAGGDEFRVRLADAGGYSYRSATIGSTFVARRAGT